jgi:hypothetical protein
MLHRKILARTRVTAAGEPDHFARISLFAAPGNLSN